MRKVGKLKPKSEFRKNKKLKKADHNAIAVGDCVQAMGNGEHCAFGEAFADGRLHQGVRSSNKKVIIIQKHKKRKRLVMLT